MPAFEIETLLGSGNGTTYLARATGTGALLAVKTFPIADAGPDVVDALDALSAALQKFHHPSVAKIHALDVDDEGTVRLISDYVRGRAFADWMAAAAPDARQTALGLLNDALLHVHRAGLAHGNLIATNVVITGGRPFLLDLGVHLALEILEDRPRGLEAMQRRDLAQLEAL